jgi:hypothetical protein
METAQLTPAEALMQGDRLGCAVAIWEDIIVVGADQCGDQAPHVGEAHVFRFDYQYGASSWDWEDSLVAGQGSGDEFGTAVAIWDQRILVGAPGRNIAHVFVHDEDDGWLAEAVLSSGGAGEEFGYAVALEGDVAVVGAPASDAQGSNSGAVYVFRYNGSEWTSDGQLLAFDGGGYADDLFGWSVAICGDRIIVGAPYADNGDGAAYLFNHDGDQWQQETRLSAAPGGLLGYAVAIDGDLAVVGASAASGTGSAVVFWNDGATWQEDAQLFASDAAPDDRFGCAVAIRGELIVVGADGQDAAGDDAGAGYVFHFNDAAWVEQAKLLASNGRAGDGFGLAVAARDRNAVLGAPLSDNQASDGGCAYVFGGLCDCQPNDTLDLCDIAQGESDDDNGTGMPDECEPVLANEHADLLPEDGTEDDLFGFSVAIDDRYIIGGAVYNEPDGAAYVFQRNSDGADNWSEDEKLTDPDPQGFELFGSSVSISGDAAVVGAPYDSPGRALVFRRDPPWWLYEAELVFSNPEGGDRIGYAVAICGDVAIVGAPWDDGNGSESGSASIFRRSGTDWEEEINITPPDGSEEDHFGHAVAISGDVVVIGMPSDDTYGNSAGAAYVYRYDGDNWIEEAVLSPQETSPNEQFGTAVAVCGDVIAIGAPGDEEGHPLGTIQVFRYDGEQSSWNPEATLAPGDGQDGDGFGQSVSVSEDTIVAGAHGDDDCGSQSGAAYAFFFNGAEWNEEAKLRASDAESSDQCGFAVAVSANCAAIGAPYDSDNGEESGSVYVFGGMSDANGNGHLDIFDIGIGWSFDENGNGIPDECECPGDFNGDGVVNTADLLHLLGCWGTECGDVDGDGDTDTADLLALLGAWGDCA